MKQRTLFSVAALSISLLATQSSFAQQASGNTSTSAKSQAVNSIVVVVNDEVITKQELNEKLITVERRLKAQGTALPDRADLQKQLLERMIIDRAQLQLAKENGMRVDDVMLDRSMQRMAEQNKMNMQEFRNQIEREGTSYARFREEIRDDIMMQRVRDREVDSKILITESEVDNFLAAEANAKAGKQELNLAHILIRIPENANADQIALRRNRAEEVLQKLRAGGDFAKLAVTYSDSAEALKGGDLGWREQDRLPQLFLDAVSKIKAGEFTDIIRSPNGFHIVKLNGQRASNDVKAEAAVVQQSHVRHILMKPNQIISEAEVLQKMQDMKKKIDSKEATFEELAKANSADGSAAKGGDLGWIFPGDTVPEFEQAMNKLAINEVSAPVKSPFGYHLIQVLERKSEDQTNDRQRMAARNALRERKSDEAYQDWLRELRDRTYVEFRTEDK
ncbi:peptidylprolyl isomerase [Undibacterium jejuense]|uniref:Chaperone SurA n=1 Tax=Undibacterium jejuense TaxID=1344949 RepID=A0A923HBR0_9BURK|nr:peptidylprolyl isomerase [Undibacterium jejuense]MBC3861016.1 peptidylprolyl isomerase [Undibacterium jejuense]